MFEQHVNTQHTTIKCLLVCVLNKPLQKIQSVSYFIATQYVTILFTGERGLEICSNGARSPVSMDLHTSRPSGNSWHHITGSNTLWWTHSNWHSPIWDCFHDSQTPYIHQSLNTTIFALSTHKYHIEAWRGCGYGAENGMFQRVVLLNQNTGNIPSFFNFKLFLI